MSPKPQIVAVDCGTQSVRCLVVDVESGALRVGASQPVRLSRTGPDAIEVDPEHLVQVTCRVLTQTLGGCDSPPIALAITNMRETAIAWRRDTGRPVHDGIMWMSQQSQNVVDRWSADGTDRIIADRSGLANHTFFFGSKIAWLFDTAPELHEAADRGDIAVGTIDSWLLYALTGGTVHATDVSNASRYQLLDIRRVGWDPGLCDALGIPGPALPEILPTSARFGDTDERLVGVRLPITGMIGDQQASLLGHGCREVGDAKVTFGTSSVVCVNTGPEVPAAPGLVSSIAWCAPPKSAVYELEGSAFHAGFTVAWLERTLALPAGAAAAMSRAPSNRRVKIIPAFTELGAPRWLKGDGASITGLGMETEPVDILRAALESMAFQARDLVCAAGLPAESGSLSVDGGGSQSDYLCQILADLTNRPVVRPASHELTGLGAARAAAGTLGLDIPSPASSGHGTGDITFEPSNDRSYALDGYAGWDAAVKQLLA